jgi:hypothetical protein
MTTPLSADVRLRTLADWDVQQARRAVTLLAGAIEALPAWRARLEGVERAVGSGNCWSGPAARGAVHALAEVSSVASALAAALGESLASYRRLLAEAGRAQELAEQALVRAASLPDPIDIRPPAAAAALWHAALAGAAAEDAGGALAGLGVRDAFAPADFPQLLAQVPLMGPIQAPPVPATRVPAEVAGWWSGLSELQRSAVISLSPGLVGALDGVPAWARDRANRLVLDRALRDPRTPAVAAVTARAVADRVAREEAAGQTVQVQLLDLAGDRVALSLGDLDTADEVAVLVPGVGNTPEDDLGRLIGNARDIATASREASHGASLATVVWLGYRTPATVLAGTMRFAAEDGGPALAHSLDGLAAARTATATGDPRTTVVAHSYGTVVVDEAADEPGRLAADAVVLLGSPGMQGYAWGLEVPAVFDAASPADPVTWAAWDGDRWTGGAYGATGLPIDPDMGHSDYLEPAFPTLAAVGEVVGGVRLAEKEAHC